MKKHLQLTPEQEQIAQRFLASIAEFWHNPTSAAASPVTYEEAVPWLRLSARIAALLCPGNERRRLLMSSKGVGGELFDLLEKFGTKDEFVTGVVQTLVGGTVEEHALSLVVTGAIAEFLADVPVEEAQLVGRVEQELKAMLAIPLVCAEDVDKRLLHVEQLQSVLHHLKSAKDILMGEDEESDETAYTSEASDDEKIEVDEAPVQEPPQDDQGKIKINRIEEDVARVQSGVVHLHELADAWAEKEVTLQTAETVDRDLRQLQRQSLGYTERLMKDLLTLDEITGAEELRPIRKKNVQRIQAMLSDLDSVRARLNAFHDDVKALAAKKKEAEAAEAAKAEAAKAEAAKAEAAKAEAAKAEAAEKAPENTTDHSIDQDIDHAVDQNTETSPQESAQNDMAADEDDDVEDDSYMSDEESTSLDYSLLRLEPKFHSSERPDTYVVSGHFPGLVEDNVTISLRRQQLVVEGVVLPTAAQEQQLSVAAQRVRAQDPRFGRTSIPNIMLRLAAGRFGKFETAFQLPQDALVNEITAGVKNGLLTINIPRVLRRNRPVRQPRYNSSLFW